MLKPAYVASKLKMPVSEVPSELIEAKRNLILTKRILKQINHQNHEKTNET